MDPVESKREVLTIGLTLQEFARVACSFDREDAEVDNLPAARAALEVVGHRRLGCLVVRYPLPDMVLPAFLKEVRGGPCRHSPLLLLAPAERVREARRYLGRGANRVLSLDDAATDADTLRLALTDLVNVAPRRRREIIAQLRFEEGGVPDWLLCRSVNASTSGVLLATQRQLAPGTLVDFELALPQARPIVGRAEVARNTLSGRERVRGVGLRFLSFSDGAERVYKALLNGAP